MASVVVGVFSAFLIDGTWGWGFALWLYLVFCIAPEIGLSGVDLQHMWRGTVPIAGAVTIARHVCAGTSMRQVTCSSRRNTSARWRRSIMRLWTRSNVR